MVNILIITTGTVFSAMYLLQPKYSNKAKNAMFSVTGNSRKYQPIN